MYLGLAACAAPAPKPVAEPAVTPEPVSEPARQVAVVTPPPMPVPDPATFLSQESGKIATALGKPNFVRRDAPAEYWQYRTATCTLDLYFYEESGGLTLAHLDFRGTDGSPDGDDDCLRAILKGELL